MATIEVDRATGLVSSAAVKAPVYLATTANITLAGEQTIDGVVTDESRVLVKSQTDATQNGIYITSTGDWSRAPDFSRNEQVTEGTRVWVTDGAVNGSTEWVVTADEIDLDVADLTFDTSTALASSAQLIEAMQSATPAAIADTDRMFGLTALGGLISLTWANVKATLKTYFDTLYLTTVAAAATYLTTAAAAVAYQAKATILTTLSGLANSAGALTNDGSGNLSWSSAGWTLATPQSPSGVSQVDFTSIPSTAKHIVVSISGVSSSAGFGVTLALGDSGGIETTNYATNAFGYTTAVFAGGNGAANNFTMGGAGAANTVVGVAILTLVDAATNTWSCFAFSGSTGTLGASDSSQFVVGTKSLSAPLDRLRLTLSAGTADAGKVNIAYS